MARADLGFTIFGRRLTHYECKRHPQYRACLATAAAARPPSLRACCISPAARTVWAELPTATPFVTTIPKRSAARSPFLWPWLPWNTTAARSTCSTCPGGFDFAGEVDGGRSGRRRCRHRLLRQGRHERGRGEGVEVLRDRTHCPVCSTSPRPTRRTPTTTPPSTRCASASARTSPPSSPPSGTRARRSSASSTCCISAHSSSAPAASRVEIEVPENKKPVLDELYDALKESVAETSEEFMEKFFAGEDFTYAEMIQGLRQGVKDLSLFPVVCGSAMSGHGHAACCWTPSWSCCPQPQEARALMAENDGRRVHRVRAVAPGALPDRFRLQDHFRPVRQVLLRQGALRHHQARYAHGQRPHRRDREARPPVHPCKGKKATEVKELACGDIGAIAKMDKVKTGDTLCEPPQGRRALKAIPFAEPCYCCRHRAQDPRPGG